MRTLHHRDGHLGWDRDLEPVAEIAPGEELVLDLADCFGGQLEADATADDVAGLDLARANPLTGPVRVAGAAPGDALRIELLEMELDEVGFTAVIPGFGLLAAEFPDPHVVVSRIGAGGVDVGGFAHLDARPFIGTIGVAPAEQGRHSVIPPRTVGGNLDCRDVRPGATLRLPVAVDGALLSAGDAHAHQGDGEVCGTAVEVAARVRLRIGLERAAAPPAPQIELPREGSHPRGARTVTTGVGPDLHACARDATRAMIDRLVDGAGLDPADAYALCSIAADLRIAEIVDAPNWVVACELDRSVLRSDGA
jgi:acetamidase/formamidase